MTINNNFSLKAIPVPVLYYGFGKTFTSFSFLKMLRFLLLIINFKLFDNFRQHWQTYIFYVILNIKNNNLPFILKANTFIYFCSKDVRV